MLCRSMFVQQGTMSLKQTAVSSDVQLVSDLLQDLQCVHAIHSAQVVSGSVAAISASNCSCYSYART